MQALIMRKKGAFMLPVIALAHFWCNAGFLTATNTGAMAGMVFVVATDKFAPKGNAPFVTVGELP